MDRGSGNCSRWGRSTEAPGYQVRTWSRSQTSNQVEEHIDNHSVRGTTYWYYSCGIRYSCTLHPKSAQLLTAGSVLNHTLTAPNQTTDNTATNEEAFIFSRAANFALRRALLNVFG